MKKVVLSLAFVFAVVATTTSENKKAIVLPTQNAPVIATTVSTMPDDAILNELFKLELVQQENNSLVFQLPFNLHGFGCGAPDCYSTDISFSYELKDNVVFPKNIPFSLHEYGCEIPEDIKLKGNFMLKEKTETYVNYYSKEAKATLIIGANKQLYFITNVIDNYVTLDNLEKVLHNYEAEINLQSIEVYRSAAMVNSEN